MSERVVTIVPEAGLHARPATTFVETAREYDAEVTVGRLDGDAVSAGSMLGVTGLGAECGEEVRLTAEGPDAEVALDALEDVLTTPEEGDEGGGADESGREAGGSGSVADGSGSGADGGESESDPGEVTENAGDAGDSADGTGASGGTD